jgi:RNase adaptor protein for sRNA GlmZ degradation
MDLPIIKVVGVSASGKSTLVQALRQAGYEARPVSQEHSHLPDLWQRFDRALYLIVLDADLAAQQARRPDVPWSAENLAEERSRVAHASAHADLQINTSAMTADQVLAVTLAFLEHHSVAHSSVPLSPVAATGSAMPHG